MEGAEELCGPPVVALRGGQTFYACIAITFPSKMVIEYHVMPESSAPINLPTASVKN